MQYCGIEIDNKRNKILSEQSLKLLQDYYCREDETSPQQAFARSAACFSNGNTKLAQRIYDYVSKGYFMYSSPVLSNAILKGEKVKALPISCFLSYVPDTLDGLIDHTNELRWLSVKGGGVGGHWNAIRSVSNIAPGPIDTDRIRNLNNDIKKLESKLPLKRLGKTDEIGELVKNIILNDIMFVIYINRHVLTTAGITTLPVALGFAIPPNCPNKFDNGLKFVAAAIVDCECSLADGSNFDRSFNDCGYCTPVSKPGCCCWNCCCMGLLLLLLLLLLLRCCCCCCCCCCNNCKPNNCCCCCC